MNETDEVSARLPVSYGALDALREEFRIYQELGFPVRGANFFALELNGEAGELANLEKKAWKGREIAPEDFADEAADVFIALMNYANARGVNLAEAVREKMRKIDRRRVEESRQG